jgi:hypothetical protein
MQTAFTFHKDLIEFVAAIPAEDMNMKSRQGK